LPAIKRGEGVTKNQSNQNPIVTLYTFFHTVSDIFHDLAENEVGCQDDVVTKIVEYEAAI